MPAETVTPPPDWRTRALAAAGEHAQADIAGILDTAGYAHSALTAALRLGDLRDDPTWRADAERAVQGLTAILLDTPTGGRTDG